MNRTQLQRLADERLADAHCLAGVGRWSAAYYLGGYAVECALKACILAFVERTGVIFTDKKFGERCWTHSVEDLVKLADLEVTRGTDIAGSANFGKNWLIVKDWTEISRYQMKSQSEAEQLLSAIDDPTDGVLPWIGRHW